MAKNRTARPRPKLDKWEVQGAADTLIREREIRANSNLLRSAKAELKRRQKAITKAIKKTPPR